MTISFERSVSKSVAEANPVCQFSLPAAKWSSRAAADLKQAAKAGDFMAFCRAWLSDVFPQPATSTRGPQGACLWSMYGTAKDDEITRLTRLAFAKQAVKPDRNHKSTIHAPRSAAEHLSALVTSLTQQSANWSPIQTITVGEILIGGRNRLNHGQIWSLWNRLAVESGKSVAFPPKESPDQLLLRAGEMPFLAGLLLEPLREAHPMRERGRRSLVDELWNRTDRDGSTHAELLSRLPLWLAPLIRATLWAERMQVELWSEEERQRLTLVLERSIPLCRPDGQLALSNGHVIPALPLFEAAAKTLSLTGPAEKLLRMLKAKPQPLAVKKRPTGGIQSMPSAQSDWARFAMLRSDWSSHADSVAIAHHMPNPKLDVAVLGRALLHGSWSLELQIGEAVIQLAPEWSCSCWASDPDADYLELQMHGPNGLSVERQVLLSRREHFLFLADNVSGARSLIKSAGKTGDEQRIHLRSRLPLAAGVTAEADRLTREVRLKAAKHTIRVFPLALADDRVQSTPHQFAAEGQDLLLQQVGVGNGLHAPLIFDWHPGRTRQPALWRTLTVTEAGKIVGRDTAAGHRLQVGKFQLLCYRSLAAASTARAVLGHHTWHETVIAQVDKNGDVEAVMNVDP